MLYCVYDTLILKTDHFSEGDGTVLYDHPFQLCVLPHFITSGGDSDEFLLNLRQELSRLKFTEKNNDLYQFHQVYTVSTLEPL